MLKRVLQHGILWRRRIFCSTIRAASTVSPAQLQLLERLRQVDTASLCDSHKSLFGAVDRTAAEPTHKTDQRFIVLSPPVVALRNFNSTFGTNGFPNSFAGMAYTVQCPQENAILPVLEALSTCPPHHVLLVHTKGSTRAVAGELFATEAHRRKISAVIILDGPIRDTGNINRTEQAGKVVPMYSSSITPYAGTANSLGEMEICLNLALPSSEQNHQNSSSTMSISPGSIVVGDPDGIVIASQNTMESIVNGAEQIVQTENQLLNKMVNEHKSLVDMTNLQEHLKQLRDGVPSKLDFKID